jgi:hypothetical protein
MLSRLNRAWKALWDEPKEYIYSGWYTITKINTSKGMRYKVRCGPRDEISYHYVLEDDYGIFPPIYLDSIHYKKYDVGNKVILYTVKK